MGERVGAAALFGQPLTLLGREIKVGESAQDFTVIRPDFRTYSLNDGRGELRLVASLPSLDTPVCDAEARRFSEEAAKLGMTVLLVSADLPFAQTRWCAANGIDNVTMLSDHRDVSFGMAFGVAIKELRILSRALFVVAPEHRVRHAEYVTELSDHPDYDAALASLS